MPALSPQHFASQALAYATEGWPVLPLQHRGKAPLCRHGVKDATTNADQICQWWRNSPEANLGIAVPHGFLVLDLDNHEAQQRLQALDLSLPTTATATTGRGLHIWFKAGDASVRNRVALFPDVDVRAPGGYVVAPPSVHPSGVKYRWTVFLERSNIADCPDWLLKALSSNGPQAVGRPPMEWHRRVAEPIGPGRRNQALAEVAGLLFRKLPVQTAAELALCWAQVKLSPPLSADEVERTIQSIATCEYRRRTRKS